MGLSDLISGVLRPLFDLIPRVYMRPASNEFMVVDGPISGPRLATWPQIIIPVIHHCEYYSAASFAIDCGLQSCTTADGKRVAVNGTMILTIEDPIALRESASQDDYEAVLSAKARAAIIREVEGLSLAYFREKGSQHLQKDLEADLLYWHGIRLERFVVEDLAECRNLRLFGDCTPLVQ